jgi:hypothetical protein
VLVTVRDTGRGLDPTGVNRLFEAFYTTKPDGMGMGLSISRSIIEAQGDDCGPARMSLAGPRFSSPWLQKRRRPFPPSTSAQCHWCELAGPGSETIAAITRSGRNFFHVPSHVPSHPQTAAKARGFFVYSLGVHR